jgi:amino acid adenylation domain-containing protein
LTGPPDAISAPHPPSRDIGPRNDFMPIEKSEIRQSIAQAFERRVAAAPDQVALECGGKRFTYDALNRAANRLAHAVIARTGDGLEPVALRLEHGHPAIIGILGALKAGKFCVPLDPALPRERALRLVEDAQARLLLADGLSGPNEGDFLPRGCAVCDVSRLDENLSEENPRLYRAPDDPAIIIYTSGSTGLPKGVIVTHCTALRTSRAAVNAYHLCTSDREALLSSYSVAASVANTFGPLLSGAVLLPFSIGRNGLGALARWLAEERITVFFSTPTVFRNLAAMRGGAQLPCVRMVALHGETIQPSDVELFRRMDFRPDCLLRITMASTEMCGHATRVFLDRNTQLPGNVVPAGWPTEDAEIAIVAEDGSESAPGETGEIVVKSAYLSPGYWRRPDLTAKAFAPDPKRPGIRLYRTGDLGRLLPDGSLVHLGRRDHQVKIRGYRVEIAEVEKALLAMDEFSNVAVAARDDANGDKRLVAYLVADRISAPTVSRLRTRLGEKLPSYMIPAAFVFMEQFPLTGGGKVDRTALPDPPAARPLLEGECRAPRNPVEERLTRLWEEILGVQPIGVQDDFFELGGHSLSAARLFARIEEDFGKRLPLPLLLHAPTIERLAAALGENGWNERGAFMVEIQPNGSRPPLFCVHTVNARIFVHLARRLAPEQPCYGLHMFGLAPARKPRVRIERLATRYLEEVRGIQPKGPYYLCGLCGGGMVAFEMAQQLKAQGEEVAFLALLDTFSPGPRRLDRDASGALPAAFNAVRQKLKGKLFRPAGNFIAYHLQRSAKHARNLSQLALDGQMAYIRQLAARRAARIQAAPNLVKRTESEIRQDEYLQQLNRYTVALLHATGSAGRRYRPKPYPGRLILFLGSETTEVPKRGARLAWCELAANGAEVHTVPGLHHHILSEPNVGVLATYFKAHLEQAQGNERAPGK